MQVVTDILAADPLPKIMGGDLNSGPNTAVLTAARGVLRDSWLAAGVGSGATARPATRRARIDYVLYSDPLVPVDSRVDYSQVSDHRAVRSTFTLSSQGEPICAPVFDEPLE